MACRSNEVEKSVHTIISEPGITLNARLLSQNIIVLSFEMSHDLRKARVVVNLVTKARRVHNGQGYACSLLIKLQFNSDRLDSDAVLNVSTLWIIVGVFALKNTLSA